MMEIGVPAYLINATLVGVVAQRLVRTLCPHCKTPDEIDESAWKPLVAPWSAPLPTTGYKAVGCHECRTTGFQGRIGLYEMMPLSPALRSTIQSEAEVAKIREQANKEHIEPLRLSGARKVAAGITTIDEILRVVPAESQL
jgi:general secretion pathway protein E